MGESREGWFIPNNKHIEILCGDNLYHHFDGISISKTHIITEIYFDDQTFLECTSDHEIIFNGIETKAKDIKIGDIFYGKKEKQVIYIDQREEEILVYDLVNAGPTHSFYVIDIVIKNCVLLDEFAHIETKLANEFYTSVYPVISSGKKTKIYMISTPKGMNLFYTFWQGAINKTNGYVPFEVHWTDVPGRDQKWYDTTIKNIGEQAFRQEFLTEFLGSSNTLISGPKLQQLVTLQTPPQTKRNEVNIYASPIKERWDTTGDEEKQLEIEHHYVMIVDTSEGKKQDYSAFVVIDITELPYKLVGTYHDNTISPLLFPTVIWSCAKYFNDAMILIETQSAGMQVADILHIELEYERLLRTFSGNKRAQQISEGHIPGAQLGVKTTRPVKDIGCMNLKTMIETDQLIIRDPDVISELTTFVLNVKGTFEADDNASDDLAMCLVLFGWLTTQTYFKDLVQHDLRKLLKSVSMDFDDQDALPSFVAVNHKEVELIRIGDDFWSDSGFEASFLDPYNHYWTDFKNRL